MKFISYNPKSSPQKLEKIQLPLSLDVPFYNIYYFGKEKKIILEE